MWQGESFSFDRETITAVVAPSPGVYLLWNAQQWLYVGETRDLRESLLTHLASADPRIAQRSPQAFGFELHFVRERCAARCQELVLELNPVCNVSHATLPRPLARPHRPRRHYAFSRLKNRA